MPKYHNVRVAEIEKYNNTLIQFLSHEVCVILLETIDEEEVNMSLEVISADM